MTKEPIMIDDVNVSTCPHLIEDYQWWNIAGQEEHDINRCALSFDEYIDFEEDDFCKENPNCDYKQLKRKEQECEELKQALQEIKEMCKQKLPAGLSAQSCYESFEAFTGYILEKCEVIKDETRN